MGRITVGLDFGTHQTKICVENKSDVNNPIYSFFPFEKFEGGKTIILPSIVQINRDNTLSYGFVDKESSLYGKKFFVGEGPSYPTQNVVSGIEVIPAPSKPRILDLPRPSDKAGCAKFRSAQMTYRRDVKAWQMRKAVADARYKSQKLQAEVDYRKKLKEWYRWQNGSQRDYRMMFRYFKQSTFSAYKWNCRLSACYLSVWYLSYVLFKLEEAYGRDFAIQMGVPTGSDNFELKKKLAVRILLSAYRLVEDVFQNDLEKYLATPFQQLLEMTELVAYSDEKKQEYGLLIFPEAYAGLKSLTERKKIQKGMSLMVDIGGGTTDISFFTIEDGHPVIYDYSSIPYGINFIAETAAPGVNDKFEIKSNLYALPAESLHEAVQMYYRNLSLTCNSLVEKLQKSFERTQLPIYKLKDALRNRPVIYSGGGSTYPQLCRPVGNFTDVRQINAKIWEGMHIDEIDSYVSLCPLISTALGLAISAVKDDIKICSVSDIFKHIEGACEEDRRRPRWV